MPGLEARALAFSYPGGARPVLRDLDLTVADGEFLAVLGPSGCGKSTLLYLLAGLERPGGGELLVGGAVPPGPGPDRGIVFQDYALFPWMTAEQNVSFCARRARRDLSRRAAGALAREYLSRVGLSGWERRYPSALSGGMRQRVDIAKILAMGPAVMLFDEPFGALDPSTRIRLQCLLESVWLSLEPRRTVVFVTHDIDEALLLADRVVYLDRGAVRDTFSVPFSRPRDRGSLLTPMACTLRKRCMRLFRESEAATDG